MVVRGWDVSFLLPSIWREVVRAKRESVGRKVAGGVEQWCLDVGTLDFCRVCRRSMLMIREERKLYPHVPVADGGCQRTKAAAGVLCFTTKFLNQL